MDAMTFFIFAAAAMTVMTLFSGIASMAHGGESDRLHSHELMFRRTVARRGGAAPDARAPRRRLRPCSIDLQAKPPFVRCGLKPTAAWPTALWT